MLLVVLMVLLWLSGFVSGITWDRPPAASGRPWDALAPQPLPTRRDALEAERDRLRTALAAYDPRTLLEGRLSPAEWATYEALWDRLLVVNRALTTRDER
jgi:hypothetical protein